MGQFGERHHLVIPFSFETNDNRFDQNNGFSTADDFATYLTDCFDLLYEEGAEFPKVMTISLHDRLIGRPAKAVGLINFSTMRASTTASGFAPARTLPSIGAGRIRRVVRCIRPREVNRSGRGS